jgi:hypothetical protein
MPFKLVPCLNNCDVDVDGMRVGTTPKLFTCCKHSMQATARQARSVLCSNWIMTDGVVATCMLQYGERVGIKGGAEPFCFDAFLWFVGLTYSRLLMC